MLKSIEYSYRIVTGSILGLIGSILTTSSALLFIGYFLATLSGFEGGPYFGILVFLINPLFFVGGLLMIPFGFWWEKRKRIRAGETVVSWRELIRLPSSPKRRKRLIIIFGGATALNVILLVIAAYQGVHVMETSEFCGNICHKVMEPEHTAFLRSAHVRVGCVGCHIGAGANWFVKSKLSGSWQVVATAFNLYPRPIESPIRNLRPARETCEQCHLPTKFVGDRLRIMSRFQEDEANTEAKTVLLMRVGGMQGIRAHGIHWHVDPGNKVEFLSDPKRETIYRVKLTKSDGKIIDYAVENAAEAPKNAEWRLMDCVDCHNRPTHVFHTPKDEIDMAMGEGRIDRTLPYIRREGLALLKASYSVTGDALRAEMTRKLMAFYQTNHPQVAMGRKTTIEEAAAVLKDLHSKNVFPKMNVTWGTYVNHLGHENSPGCWRCHDGSHKTKDGQVISDDCTTCHSLLANEEVNPKILTDLQP